MIGARRILAAVTPLLGFTACGPTPIADPRADLLASWGAWLLERYDATAAAADALGLAVADLCAAPDAARLDAARARWQDARRPWKEAEVFAFGPYAEEPIRLGPKADFWPARPDAVREVLSADGPIEAAGLGSQQKGFAAIELLLWDPEVDVVAALADEPRRCLYLGVVVPDLAARVRELADVWRPTGGDFLGELTEAGERDTMYDTLHMAFGEVVNRVGYLVENVRNDKLARPAGLLSGSGAQPDKLESPFSGRALEDIRDNLEGARRLLLGDGAGDLGLDGYLRGRGRFLRPLVNERLDDAYAALDELEDAGPIATTIGSHPALVEALVARLGDLQRAVQVDVLSSLSLTVGFNDNDGD